MYPSTGLPAGAVATPEGNLTIGSASLAHNGSYTCIVKNVGWSVTAHLEVIVQGECACMCMFCARTRVCVACKK